MNPSPMTTPSLGGAAEAPHGRACLGLPRRDTAVRHRESAAAPERAHGLACLGRRPT